MDSLDTKQRDYTRINPSPRLAFSAASRFYRDRPQSHARTALMENQGKRFSPHESASRTIGSQGSRLQLALAGKCHHQDYGDPSLSYYQNRRRSGREEASYLGRSATT
jgi:hypothetical protein